MIVRAELEEYAEAHTTPPAAHLRALAEETRQRMPGWGMMVGTLEGRFLEFLVWLAQPSLVLEIGTFTGYSAQSMAAALPPGGRIVSCEVDPEHAAIARRHIESGPHRGRIDIRLGPALDTIAELPGPFDLVFIDADKVNYVNYYEAVLPKLAERGLIVADNVLWSGRVIDPSAADESTVGIRAFNDHVRDDPRVIAVMLTIRDGVTMIRRAS
jgi:caffeoyl-CoA O-methyltransferase